MERFEKPLDHRTNDDQHQQQQQQQQQQEEPQCCIPGPIYSRTGIHTFVHCPNLCKTCAGIARLEHPYLVCAWNSSHGMVEQGLGSTSPAAAAEAAEAAEAVAEGAEDHSEQNKEQDDEQEKYKLKLLRTCFTCNIRCTNIEQLKEHLRGKRHQRQVKAFSGGHHEEQQQQQQQPDDHYDDDQNQDQELFHRSKKRKGMQHASTSQQDEGILVNSTESRRKFMRLRGQVPNCEVCNVICTSWGVLEDHFESKRHLGRIKHLQSQARCGDEQACSRLEVFQGQMRILHSQYR